MNILIALVLSWLGLVAGFFLGRASKRETPAYRYEARARHVEPVQPRVQETEPLPTYIKQIRQIDLLDTLGK